MSFRKGRESAEGSWKGTRGRWQGGTSNSTLETDAHRNGLSNHWHRGNRLQRQEFRKSHTDTQSTSNGGDTHDAAAHFDSQSVWIDLQAHLSRERINTSAKPSTQHW